MPEDFAHSQRQARDPQYCSPLAEAPLKRVSLKHLTKIERFPRGSGWGKNAWGEPYKGPVTTHYYVKIPAEWNRTHNVLVEVEGGTMLIERDQAPAFTKPKSQSDPELLAYFPWMGGV